MSPCLISNVWVWCQATSVFSNPPVCPPPSSPTSRPDNFLSGMNHQWDMTLFVDIVIWFVTVIYPGLSNCCLFICFGSLRPPYCWLWFKMNSCTKSMTLISTNHRGLSPAEHKNKSYHDDLAEGLWSINIHTLSQVTVLHDFGNKKKSVIKLLDRFFQYFNTQILCVNCFCFIWYKVWFVCSQNIFLS